MTADIISSYTVTNTCMIFCINAYMYGIGIHTFTRIKNRWILIWWHTVKPPNLIPPAIIIIRFHVRVRPSMETI